MHSEGQLTVKYHICILHLFSIENYRSIYRRVYIYSLFELFEEFNIVHLQCFYSCLCLFSSYSYQVRESLSFSPSHWTAALVSSCWAMARCWSNTCWRMTAASTCVRSATTWELMSASPCTSPSKVRVCAWCAINNNWWAVITVYFNVYGLVRRQEAVKKGIPSCGNL